MLSNTVAKAIKFHWGDEAAGTIMFIEMMDKLFDCLIKCKYPISWKKAKEAFSAAI